MIASTQNERQATTAQNRNEISILRTSMVSDSFTLVSTVSTPVRSNAWSVMPLCVLFPLRSTLMLLYWDLKDKHSTLLLLCSELKDRQSMGQTNMCWSTLCDKLCMVVYHCVRCSAISLLACNIPPKHHNMDYNQSIDLVLSCRHKVYICGAGLPGLVSRPGLTSAHPQGGRSGFRWSCSP